MMVRPPALDTPREGYAFTTMLFYFGSLDATLNGTVI
jgi:hypothetical protein